MSIIGEFLHDEFAQSLAKMLIAAVEDQRFSNCRSCARGFAKEVIYPEYLSELSGSYSSETELDRKVKQYYGK